jgi:hypothetical protein
MRRLFHTPVISVNVVTPVIGVTMRQRSRHGRFLPESERIATGNRTLFLLFRMRTTTVLLWSNDGHDEQ